MNGTCTRCEGEGVMPTPDPDPTMVTSRLGDHQCYACGGTGSAS